MKNGSDPVPGVGSGEGILRPNLGLDLVRDPVPGVGSNQLVESGENIIYFKVLIGINFVKIPNAGSNG